MAAPPKAGNATTGSNLAHLKQLVLSRVAETMRLQKRASKEIKTVLQSVAVARVGSALFVENDMKAEEQAKYFLEQYKLFVKGREATGVMEEIIGWVDSRVFGSGSSKPSIFTEKLFLTKDVNVS